MFNIKKKNKTIAFITSFSLITGGLSTVMLSSANAADTSYSTVSITKVSDGTGHDAQESQCFINEENGYTVGDNTPTDGVVCVNDQVTYNVSVAFQAGPARDVNIRLTGFNDFAKTSLLCRDTEIATARGNDANCTFRVKAGAVGSIDRTVMVTPTGLAEDVRAKISVTGGTSALAAPVTVVGSPMMDLRFIQSSDNYTQAAKGKGQFTLRPQALNATGWAESKGVISSGTSWKIDKIEGFPEGTTFTVNDTTPLIGNTFTGAINVVFELPLGEYPDEEQQDPVYKTFYPKVFVNKDSFSITANGKKLLNNGDGSEPGTAMECNTSTSTFGFGAVAGRFAPNNNCGVYNFTYKPNGVYNKSMFAPNDPKHDYLHINNRDFTKTSYVRGGVVAPAVTEDTQLKASLSMDTNEFTEVTPSPVIMCDTWTDPRVVFDSTRDFEVTLGGEEMSSSLYRVQYTTTENLQGDCNNTSWTSVKPTDDKTVKGVKFTFLNGVVNKDSNILLAYIPMKSETGFTLDDNGDNINDIGGFYWGSENGTDLAATQLLVPAPPVDGLEVETTTTQIDGLISEGGVITHNVAPHILNHEITEPQEIKITLDPCETSPKLVSGPYTMSVEKGTATCSNPTGTSTVVTFTPTDETEMTWNQGYNRTEQSQLTFTTNLSKEVDNTGTDGYTVTTNFAYGTATDASTLLSPQSSGRTSFVESNPKLVEINKDLNWTVDIARRGDGETAQSIIILPESGSTSAYDGSDPSNTYPDSKESNYHGEVYLSKLELVDSSPGTKLYVNTNRAATFDSAGWVEYTDGMELSDYLSVKVVTPDSIVSAAQVKVTMTPTDNRKGDVYVLGLTETPVDGLEQLPKPWPAEVKVVSSSISGTIVDDRGEVYSLDDLDNPYSGITVNLKDKDGDTVATTTTDDKGYYEFVEINSGNYTVEVVRSSGIPDSVTDNYGQQQDVVNSFSYPTLTKSNAKDVATVLVPIGTVVNHVDFGYLSPDPQLLLDKEATGFRDNGDGTVTASWDVIVRNAGNVDLTNVDFTDNLPAGAFDVNASITYENLTSFKPDSYNNMYSIISDSNGQVYYWSMDGSLIKLEGETTKPLISTAIGFSYYPIWVDSDGVIKFYSPELGDTALSLSDPEQVKFEPGLVGMFFSDNDGNLYSPLEGLFGGEESLLKVPEVKVEPNKSWSSPWIVDVNGNIIDWSNPSEPIEDFTVPQTTFDEYGDLEGSSKLIIVGNDKSIYYYDAGSSSSRKINISGIGTFVPGTFATLAEDSTTFVISNNEGTAYKIDIDEETAVELENISLAPGQAFSENTFAPTSNGGLGLFNSNGELLNVVEGFVPAEGTLDSTPYKSKVIIVDAYGVPWTITLKTSPGGVYETITTKIDNVKSTAGLNFRLTDFYSPIQMVDKYGQIYIQWVSGITQPGQIDSNGIVLAGQVSETASNDMRPILLTDSNGEVQLVKSDSITPTGIITDMINSSIDSGEMFTSTDGKLHYFNPRVIGEPGLASLEDLPDGVVFNLDKQITNNTGDLFYVSDTEGRLWRITRAGIELRAALIEGVTVSPNQLLGASYDIYTSYGDNNILIIDENGEIKTYNSNYYSSDGTIINHNLTSEAHAGKLMSNGYVTSDDGTLIVVSGGSHSSKITITDIKTEPNLFIDQGHDQAPVPYIFKDVETDEYKWVDNRSFSTDIKTISLPIEPTLNALPGKGFYIHTNGDVYQLNVDLNDDKMKLLSGFHYPDYAGQAITTNTNAYLMTDSEGVIYSHYGKVNNAEGILMEPNKIYPIKEGNQVSMSFTDKEGILHVLTWKDPITGTVINSITKSLPELGKFEPNKTLSYFSYISNSAGELFWASNYVGGGHPVSNEWQKVGGIITKPFQNIPGSKLVINNNGSITHISGLGGKEVSVTSESETAPITIKTGVPFNIGDLKAGVSSEQVKVSITATFRKGSEPQNLANQAWATSDQAPYQTEHGNPSTSGSQPDPADGTNIDGNLTCTALGFDGDICDQVPLSIPATNEPLGSLSGQVWYDPNHDGIRTSEELEKVNDITVTLYKGDTNYGTTITDENGYYEFVGLPGGEDYRVVWGLIGETYNDRPIAISPQTTEPSDSNNDSNSEGSTGDLTVTAGETLENVDAGVWTPTASISVTKTFYLNGEWVSEAELETVNGKTDEVTVKLEFTNTGQEALERLSIVDLQDGKTLPDFSCEPTLDGLILPVGEKVTCTAILPAMDAGDYHYDLATVTGYGVLTGQEVSGEDDVIIMTPQPGPSISVKKYVNDSNWGVSGASPSNVATTDTDPSDAQTSGTAVSTPPGEIKTTYVVTNDGNLPASFVTLYDVVNGEQVPINGTCPLTTLAAGESMVCYGTQTFTTGTIIETPAVVTAVASVFNSPLIGLTDTDEAFVELQGNAKVTVYYSVDGSECNEASANCIPLEDVPVSIGGNTADTGNDGSHTSDPMENGDTTVTVILPDWSTIVSTVVNGGDPTTDTSTTVTIVPGETQEVVVTVKLNPEGNEGPDPDSPYFESGV